MEAEVQPEVQLEGQLTEPVVEGSVVEEAKEEEITSSILCQPIFLTQSNVLVGIGDSDKNLVKKSISYDDFYRIFSEMMMKENREATSNLLLPSNCFFLGYSESSLRINVYYPETTENITYGNSTFKGRVPNMILSFSLTRGRAKNEWKIAWAKYFCTDMPVSMLSHNFISDVNTSSRIYMAPFWNTYSEGNMCFGNNTMPGTFVKGNLRGLDYYYQFLFNSPFNNDLGVRGIISYDTPSEWISTLKKAAKEGKFPYERLRGYTPQA